MPTTHVSIKRIRSLHQTIANEQAQGDARRSAVLGMLQGLIMVFRNLCFNRPDVQFVVGLDDRIHISACANDGCRAVAAIIDDTGYTETHYGPYGGPNAFGVTPMEKLGDVAIPTMGAIVTGSAGNRVHLTVHVSPEAWLLIMPANDTDAREVEASITRDAMEDHDPQAAREVASAAIAALTPGKAPLGEMEKLVLCVYSGIKGGYRTEYLDKIPNAGGIVESLVACRMLKRNKAGATQITTEGKNAIEGMGSMWQTTWYRLPERR